MAVGVRAHESDLSSAKEAVAAIVYNSIPVSFHALLSAYKKHGQLGIRVERMLPKTRFSKGNRKSEASWSLLRDHLDDLQYLLPEGVDENHSLCVRIIGLDRGDTLAVLDVPLKQLRAAEGAKLPSTVAEHDLFQLQSDLQRAQATLAKRDAELIEALKQVERLSANPVQDKSHLDTERLAWKAEENARFVAAEARWKQATAQELKKMKDGYADQRESWLKESSHEMERVESTWRTAERTRLETQKQQLESLWQKRMQDAVAAAKKDAAAAHAAAAATSAVAPAVPQPVAPRDDRETEALRQELAALKSKIEERDAAMARYRTQHEDEQQRLRKQITDATSQAERHQQSTFAARLAEAENHWRERSAAETRDIAARATESEQALAQMRQHMDGYYTLQNELTTLRATLMVREAELTQARDRLGYHQYLPEDPEKAKRAAETQEAAAKNARIMRYVRDGGIAGVIGIVAIVFSSDFLSLFSSPPPVAVQPTVTVAQPAPELPVAAVKEETKLREEPWRKAKAFALLNKGDEVRVIERRDDWSLVRVGEGASLREGWVKNSALEVKAAP